MVNGAFIFGSHCSNYVSAQCVNCLKTHRDLDVYSTCPSCTLHSNPSCFTCLWRLKALNSVPPCTCQQYIDRFVLRSLCNILHDLYDSGAKTDG